MKENKLEHPSLARYGVVAQVFHWGTAILVLVTFIYGPGGSEQRVYSPARDFDRQLHETLGLCVFALVVMRILWRMLDTRPESPQVPPWMDLAAKAVIDPKATSKSYDFTKVEALDSDGDGVKNIDEIKAGTNPGDPASK